MTLVSVVLAAVDKAMDVGLRENDDDDVIDEARRGEGTRGERRGQRVRRRHHDHDSDAEIEYGYRGTCTIDTEKIETDPKKDIEIPSWQKQVLNKT